MSTEQTGALTIYQEIDAALARYDEALADLVKQLTITDERLIKIEEAQKSNAVSIEVATLPCDLIALHRRSISAALAAAQGALERIR